MSRGKMAKATTKPLTLKEAIEVITSMKHVCRTLFPPKQQTALSLGIEAMKALDDFRRDDFTYLEELLPGEEREPDKV